MFSFYYFCDKKLLNPNLNIVRISQNIFLLTSLLLSFLCGLAFRENFANYRTELVKYIQAYNSKPNNYQKSSEDKICIGELNKTHISCGRVEVIYSSVFQYVVNPVEHQVDRFIRLISVNWRITFCILGITEKKNVYKIFTYTSIWPKRCNLPSSKALEIRSVAWRKCYVFMRILQSYSYKKNVYIQ